MGLSYLIGNAPQLKIYDFLAEMRPFDYSSSQIADATGVSRNTVEKKIQAMMDSGVVMSTRKIGRIQLYALSDSTFNKKVMSAIIEGMNNQ